ncbi:hypothetical protein ACRALDRAFT_2029155 [Sodiomyces alcalophilus JCM 7366]|uniref:uncharacterized protein n=1 Tax=Sodiomyces alcalophilus JCM 7366 TaxID=591952 RepID=UPI0039B4A678
MMTPRGFLYSNKHSSLNNPPQRQRNRRHNLPSPPASPPTPSPISYNRPDRRPSSTRDNSTPASNSSYFWDWGWDWKKDASDLNSADQPITPPESTDQSIMVKRKATNDFINPPPSTMSRTTTSMAARPMTPTSPVQIPCSRSKQTASRSHVSHAPRKPSRPRDVHNPDTIPPAVAALLALTDIPRPQRRLSRAAKKAKGDRTLTLDAVIERQQVPEKQLSFSMGKSMMDVLLSPPEELDLDEAMSLVRHGGGTDSPSSTRASSVGSPPSLGGSSLASDCFSSIGTPVEASPRIRRGKRKQPRRFFEPVLSPPGQPEDHPLSVAEDELDEMYLDVFPAHQDGRPDGGIDENGSDARSDRPVSDFASPLRPLKFAFKSNLTASLKALRLAAKSISSMNMSSIPPDDLLTRSLLSIDHRVPYTDERRPPVLEEAPSAALRRYLNPTTSARVETHRQTATATARSATRSFTASIQMQTYRVRRSRSESPGSPTRSPYPLASSSSTQSTPPQPPARSHKQTALAYPPGGMRQREVRENPDFIRIAVMEMAMRRRGKLDDQRPGRARWALPPRRPSSRPYEVGADGVPARWVPISY